MKKCDSWIISVDEDTYEFKIVDNKILNRYALKADVNHPNGSKQLSTHPKHFGLQCLEPKYNPNKLADLLDINTYHAACVDAVAGDAAGIKFTLVPVEGETESEVEHGKFMEFLNNCEPSINTNIYQMLHDRRAIGYGALEVIRQSVSKSPIMRVKHIPAHTLRRHIDEKRLKQISDFGKDVWFVLYGRNYNEKGQLCDVHVDTGEWHPYNSLSPEKRANEILWTSEYSPSTSYYGRPPIIGSLLTVQSMLSAKRYHAAFFENYGMPAFAVMITGDFEDYNEPQYLDETDANGQRLPNPDYDPTQTIRYKITQQIKQTIKNPHSAICITVPSEDGNVDVRIQPLSVQTKDSEFNVFLNDERDEILHAHMVDPSRLGIYDDGKLNGSNSQYINNSYKYGTVAPLKKEAEDLINMLVKDELGVNSWEYRASDLDPRDYKKDIKLAEFLFSKGAMTPRDLFNNFGGQFGLTAIEDSPYLDEYYVDCVPLKSLFNPVGDKSNSRTMGILRCFHDKLRSIDVDIDKDVGVLAMKGDYATRQIKHLLSSHYEQELVKEISLFFARMEKQTIENLKRYYNQDRMYQAHMDRILEPINDAHRQYFETIFKYQLKEFNKSRTNAKRIVEMMLHFKRKGNVRFKTKVFKSNLRDSVSSTINKENLFGTLDVSHQNLENRTYNFCENTLRRVNRDINNIVAKGYREGKGIDKVGDDIQKRFGQLETWEAKRIARTEIHISHNQGIMQGYYDMDVEYLEWSTSIDGRQRDSHEYLNGEIIRIGGLFSNGLHYPGDSAGEASEIINCRCQALPFIMPPGAIAPPGMEQFRESDLIYVNAPDLDGLIENANQDLRGFQLSESNIPTRFPSDNTPIPALENENVKTSIDEFSLYVEYNRETDLNREYLEVYDISGNQVFYKRGKEYGVELKGEELFKIKEKSGVILIHNHPSLFDNLHSFDDLWLQLNNNFPYSIVESYTKRYIVVNSNKLSNESKQIILNELKEDNRHFKEKINSIVETRLALRIEGQDYDYLEIKKIKDEIYDEVIIENMDYFERKISRYFEEDTGLKLYVHDRV